MRWTPACTWKCAVATNSPTPSGDRSTRFTNSLDMKGNHAAPPRASSSTSVERSARTCRCVARDGPRHRRMALFLRGSDALYGRYWGAAVEVSGLHFELCYYRGIDYAIREGSPVSNPARRASTSWRAASCRR